MSSCGFFHCCLFELISECPSVCSLMPVLRTDGGKTWLVRKPLTHRHTHIISSKCIHGCSEHCAIFVFWGVEVTMLVVGVYSVLLNVNLKMLLCLYYVLIKGILLQCSGFIYINLFAEENAVATFIQMVFSNVYQLECDVCFVFNKPELSFLM